MPKMKTKRSAAKRFKVTGTGKLCQKEAQQDFKISKRIQRRPFQTIPCCEAVCYEGSGIFLCRQKGT